jgi:acetylornithine deacetylase
LVIERRTIPGETEAQAVNEIQTLVDQLTASDPTFKATVKTLFAREPFEVSNEASIVKILDRAATKVLGQPVDHGGVSFWTDAALLAAAGIETVLFGPHGEGAHAAVEWVDLQSVEQAALSLAQTAAAFCIEP